MLNRHGTLRAISRMQIPWRELLFWTLLLSALQSLESEEWRMETIGLLETIAFLGVAISSSGKLDGLGLEFTCWMPIGPRAATVSVASGFLAGGAVAIVALRSRQALGADGRWNKVVLAVLLGPVVEEVIFRGYLLTAGLHLVGRGPKRKGTRYRDRNGAGFRACSRRAAGHHGIQLCCIAVTGTLYGIIRLRHRSTVAAVLAHGSYNLAVYVAFWAGLSSS